MATFEREDRWLAIPRSDESHLTLLHDPDYAFGDIAKNAALFTLRALSHTCRYLRCATLPLLWKTVCVRTIEELGRLNEYLKVQPLIAAHVRYFCFTWDMNGDCDKCQPYSQEHGTLLDMAFIDRGALWNGIRHEFMPSIRPVSPEDDEYEGGEYGTRFYFELGGVKYLEPGLPCDSEAAQHMRINTKNFSKLGYDRVAYHAIAASGPDGVGPDKRIKNVNNFNTCITEVVALLAPSLRQLDWESTVAHMPTGVFEALQSAPSLNSLHLDLSVQRSLGSTRKSKARGIL